MSLPATRTAPIGVVLPAIDIAMLLLLIRISYPTKDATDAKEGVMVHCSAFISSRAALRGLVAFVGFPLASFAPLRFNLSRIRKARACPCAEQRLPNLCPSEPSARA
jgi:hypothetical protein